MEYREYCFWLLINHNQLDEKGFVYCNDALSSEALLELNSVESTTWRNDHLVFIQHMELGLKSNNWYQIPLSSPDYVGCYTCVPQVLELSL